MLFANLKSNSDTSMNTSVELFIISKRTKSSTNSNKGRIRYLEKKGEMILV